MTATAGSSLSINPGDMGLAIGKKGASIKKASEVMGKKIEVVEYNSNVEQFLKNCFLPAQVTSILFEGEGDQQTATVEVRDEDRGIAIGKDGKNIFKAKKLSLRQHNIADVQILQKPMDGAAAEDGRVSCNFLSFLFLDDSNQYFFSNLDDFSGSYRTMKNSSSCITTSLPRLMASLGQGCWM